MHNLDFRKLEEYFVIGLRLSLALIFFWFGALKVIGYNPVYDIVYATFPFLAGGAGNIALGFVEAVIGVGLALNIFPVAIHIALILHLSGTMLTFLVAPELMFEPIFPILTLSGEFVAKNAVLAMAGLVVVAREVVKRGRVF